MNDKIVTRFPPEPNGYLHLGHIKAMHIDFTFSKNNNGICLLRFDDTNPTAEKQEYIDGIIENIKFLDFTLEPSNGEQLKLKHSSLYIGPAFTF